VVLEPVQRPAEVRLDPRLEPCDQLDRERPPAAVVDPERLIGLVE
jgi:hypothetical protein